MSSVKSAGYIIAVNEEGTISRAVGSLLCLTPYVLVLDGGSVDHTVARARDAGATVIHRPFTDFADQRQAAVTECLRLWNPQWVFALDSDEWLSDELVSSLRKCLEEGGLKADIYLVHLRTRFSGRILRHGGYSNTWLPRVFRPAMVTYESRGVNEHLLPVPGAQIDRLNGYLEHADVASWDGYIAKHNRYSSLEAAERLWSEGQVHTARTTATNAIIHDFQQMRRAPHLRRRFIRQHLWNRLPGKPVLRFAYIYIFRRGFLDGSAGLNRAVFESWQELCIDLKFRALRSSAPS